MHLITYRHPGQGFCKVPFDPHRELKQVCIGWRANDREAANWHGASGRVAVDRRILAGPKRHPLTLYILQCKKLGRGGNRLIRNYFVIDHKLSTLYGFTIA